MNKSSLCLLCAALTLPLSAIHAQEDGAFRPPPLRASGLQESKAPAPLDGNYLLTLSSKNKQEVTDRSFVVATPEFSFTSGQPLLTMNGTLTQREEGVYLIDYLLALNVEEMFAGANHVRNTSTKASVLLRLGETAQVIRDGDRVYSLRLERYKPAPAAPAATP